MHSDVASLQPRELSVICLWIGSKGCGGDRSGQLLKWCDGGHGWRDEEIQENDVFKLWKMVVGRWEMLLPYGNVTRRVGESSSKVT